MCSCECLHRLPGKMHSVQSILDLDEMMKRYRGRSTLFLVTKVFSACITFGRSKASWHCRPWENDQHIGESCTKCTRWFLLYHYEVRMFGVREQIRLSCMEVLSNLRHWLSTQIMLAPIFTTQHTEPPTPHGDCDLTEYRVERLWSF